MNVPILMKILNKLTLYSLQRRFWKRLKRPARPVDRSALDTVLQRGLQVKLQPEVQRLAELLGRELNNWSRA